VEGGVLKQADDAFMAVRDGKMQMIALTSMRVNHDAAAPSHTGGA
jgi:hypothetical protein